ncbi:hypothetical protein H2248_010057 [Termitomyces sp. 'cryptogamus']|nr:hypothetical protein H2248_010057 [Termitomyces sp. 'cryptogamus']
MFPSYKRSFHLELLFFCFLRTSEALTLNSPSTPLIIGSSLQVTWASTPTDPPSFNLDAVCIPLATLGVSTTIHLTSNPVNTGVGAASVIPSLSEAQVGDLGGIQLDIPCQIRATSSIVLAKVDTTLNIGGSPPPSTSISTIPSSSSSISSLSISFITLTNSTSTVTLLTTSTLNTVPASTLFFVPSITSNRLTTSFATPSSSPSSSSTSLKSSAVENVTATSNSFTSLVLSSSPGRFISSSTSNRLDMNSTLAPVFTANSNATNTLPTATPAPQASDKKATPTGVIVGGVMGGFAVVAVIGVIIFILWRRHRNHQNELGDLNFGVDDEWFGPPPGTRSPGPAEFDSGVREPREMIQHRDTYAYPNYSPPSETGYQASYTRHDDLAHGYQDHDLRAFSSSPIPSGRIRRDTHNLSSSSNGSTSGLLTAYT